MTKTEAISLWRILTILAGYDEIIAVEEVEADLDLLLDHMPAAIKGDFDLDDYEQMLESLRAQIDCNLACYAAAQPPLSHVEDVQGCEQAGIT